MSTTTAAPHHQESPLPRLLEDVAQLNTQLHELNVRNYRQVVDARESLSRCNSIATSLQSAVEQTTDEALPTLRQRLVAFQDAGRSLCLQQKKTALLVDLNAGLVDLLSIPQLMDTFSRGGAVEEALELCSFARTLRVRHDAIAELKQQPGGAGAAAGGSTGATGATGAATGGQAIVRQVQREVEASALHLRKQLLGQLRGNIDLPTCLRVLSHLKRLDGALSQQQPSLQQDFLLARDAYLAGQLVQLTDTHNDLPYQTCLKHIQKNRDVWFDVITQFQAVFGGGGDADAALLARWVRAKVRAFLHALEHEFAPKLDNCGEIGTVYEMCSSFASSLGRVGADFRPLVQRVFCSRARDICRQAWRAAGESAQLAFGAGEFGEASISSSSAAVGTEDASLAPSPLLLHFPPLVDLCNAMLRALNDLRSFACLNLVHALAGELVGALDLAVQGLEQYNTTALGGDQGQRRFQQLLDLMANQLLPYVARCFSAVFDMTQQQQQPGGGKKTALLLVDVQPLCARVRRMVVAGAVPVVVVASVAAPAEVKIPQQQEEEDIPLPPPQEEDIPLPPPPQEEDSTSSPVLGDDGDKPTG